jgi:cyclopropane fatty-acyl-phospholipid synthase-like methyltransferase
MNKTNKMISTVPDTWYETFFTGINCEMWEKAIPEEWSAKEAEFLIDVLGVGRGSAILDIPSGFGRLAVPLARSGYNLTCVDISERFLSSLDKIVKAENLPVRIIQGNILTMEINGSFDGAICMGNSFGYFDYDNMKLFVKKVASCLKTGARFIINSGMLAESILKNIPAEKTYVLDNLSMQVNNEYVVGDSYMISHLTYKKNDLVEKHDYKHYVYTVGELGRLLNTFGLKIVAIYSNIEKSIYEYGSQQAFIVSEKM